MKHYPMKQVALVALVLCAGGAEASIVEMTAVSIGSYPLLTAVFDSDGQALPGDPNSYLVIYDNEFTGYAEGYFYAFDADGNVIISHEYGYGDYSLDPLPFNDPAISYETFYRDTNINYWYYFNATDQPLYADFAVDYVARASVEVSLPTGKGTARASLDILGLTPGGFHVSALAEQHGIGADSTYLEDTMSFRVLVEPGAELRLYGYVTRDFSGSYAPAAPVPLPASIPLLSSALALLALVRRSRRVRA